MSVDEEKAIGELKAVYSGAVQAGEIRIAEMIKGGIDLIKKQQEEIEFYKSIIITEKKKYKNTKKSLKGQIEKKDKIINEMAKYLIGLVFTDKNQSEFMFNNKQDIIDYFTKKVEE